MAYIRPENEFERSAAPILMEFLRVPVSDLETVVLQVQCRAQVNDVQSFFRAEARILWSECADSVSEKLQNFHMLHNSVQVLVDINRQEAKFGPRGNIIMSIKGRGLGSYLMSKVISWLRTEYPDVKVLPGSLAHVDATDETNRRRRNQFYKSHGFDLSFVDETQMSGSFSKDRASKLVCKPSVLEVFALDDVVKLYAAAASRARKAIIETEGARKNSERNSEEMVKLRKIVLGAVALALSFVAFPVVPRVINAIVVALIAGPPT